MYAFDINIIRIKSTAPIRELNLNRNRPRF